MSNDSPFNRGSRLDRAIDRAVHDMVRRDPPAGLGRRVLEGLDRPARASWIPRLALTTAAIAAAVLAAIYLRPQPAPVVPQAVSIAANAPAQPALAAPLPATGVARAELPAQTPQRARATDRLIPMPRIRNVFPTRADQAAGASLDTWQMRAPADTALAIDSAPSGERIGALGAAPLQTGAITIAPLQIEQLHISPLRK